MTRICAKLLLPSVLIWAGAQAATINTTLTVTNAAVTIGTNITVAGPATLTNIGNGSGQFSASIALTSITGQNAVAPYTITLSGGDSIKGNLTVPVLALTAGGSITGSATVTGGTGAYANATGSFPTLTGSTSGSIGTSMTISFSGAGTITTGGSGGGGTTTPTPTITDVLDAGSYTADIAEGSIFVVKGSDLSGSGFSQFGFPLPTTSTNADKTQIMFTSATGGASTPTPAYLIYTYNQGGVNQLAAILPSTLPAGTYNVTVTANGATSAPFTAKVVKTKAALFTQDTTGGGLVVAQNVVSATQYDINRFTTGSLPGGYTISPAKPGETLVAYATGLGPVPGGDNIASSGYDFTKNGYTVAAVVGGRSIPALYAGRTPTLAGLDQINFTLPADVPTGCTVPFQLSVNGALSPATFISIAPDASSSACVQPGFTTDELTQYDNGKTFTTGNFNLSQMQITAQGQTIKTDAVGGEFIKYTGFELAALGQYRAQVSNSGACQVVKFSGSTSNISTVGNIKGLDAGTITFSGPGITSPLPLTQDADNSYALSLGIEGLSLPGQPNITLGAGTYTLTGAGGTEVNPFNASVTIGNRLTITGGLPATVTRSAGLPLGWTGGNSSDQVQIIGISGTSTGTGASATVNGAMFICTTTAGAGSFTVPASVLSQLPQTPPQTDGGTGFLEVASGPTPTSFNATLKDGTKVDSATFSAIMATAGLTSYQ